MPLQKMTKPITLFDGTTERRRGRAIYENLLKKKEAKIIPPYGSDEAHHKKCSKECEYKFVKFPLQCTPLGRHIHGIHHDLSLNPNHQNAACVE